jgi:hypothetical protein
MSLEFRAARRRASANPAFARFLEENDPIGPFINAKPRLLPGQRFNMGLNVFTEQPVTIALSLGDPSLATVPDHIESEQFYTHVSFEIVGRAVGETTLTATLGNFSVSTPVRVVKDEVTIKSLVGSSHEGHFQFIHELDTDNNFISIGMSGPVIGDTVVKLKSATPEVASVPEQIIIPDQSVGGEEFPLELHRVGTTLVSAECRGTSVEILIEVIAPVLRIESIEPQTIHAKIGEEYEVRITMSHEIVREIAITLEAPEQLQIPTAAIIRRGERSGTFKFRALQPMSPSDGVIGIRWRNALSGALVHAS